MIYDLNNILDMELFKSKVKKAIQEKKIVNFSFKMPIRSNQQNRYLHLLFSWYGIEYGETLEYVKQDIFKKVVNREIFKTTYENKKTGKVREDWRSTSDLDTNETTIAIDRFRNYSGKNGIYLPEANEKEFLQQIEIEIQKYKRYI